MENNIITSEEREEILDNMENLLSKYNYEYSTKALNKIIDTWADQKADLIALFKKHPNYVQGKFLIAFNSNWSRQIDRNGIKGFCNWICENLSTIKANLPEYVHNKIQEEAMEFNYNTKEYERAYPLTKNADFLYYNFSFIDSQLLNENQAKYFNYIDPSMRFSAGQKMSRAINKICTWLGIDKLPDYNKEFAKFADSVNPLKIVRHTIISINPIDYLTMSFGNSWASCHTIDKRNVRHMPNSYEGQYSSGTISYMLDKVSMVFYTVSANYNGNKYFFQDKINRNMFHYGKDKLIQGRVYPQSNDYNAENIYKNIREIVQKVIADCAGIPNYWTTKKGTNAISDYVLTEGTHYPDYTNFENCCISFPKENYNSDIIKIGHDPICIECGEEHSTSENINCCRNQEYTCYNCGCYVNEDDMIVIDGEHYCRDCAGYCDCCEEYTTSEFTYIERENRYVCSDCLDEYYIYCEHCDEYVHRDDATEIYNGSDVCNNCLDEFYRRCDECGEWYPIEDTHYDEHSDKCYCNDCWEDINANEEVK